MCVCLCVCVCVCVFIIIILIIIVTITQAKVEEMRYAGPSTFGSRRIVDEYDAKLSEANAKCDKNRKRFDKMAKLLVNAKAGIQVIFFFGNSNGNGNDKRWPSGLSTPRPASK